MKCLKVQIEKMGEQIDVGKLLCDDSGEAVFSYEKNYMDSGNRPISLSLPFQEEPFQEQQTRIFFEGLLPEGFTRKCVAQCIQADEGDYLSMLTALGRECLGAIRILNENYEETEMGYHILSEQQVKAFAREGAAEAAHLVTKSHLALTGASGKAGLYYDEAKAKWYLPMGNAPSTHIVKQSHVRLGQIVANEQLCLLTAKNLGINVPESFIFDLGHGKDEDVLFATRRYDRSIGKDGKVWNDLLVPMRLHQEDFSQAMGICASKKYERDGEQYLRKMFRILRDQSADPINDMIKLWDIVIFNVLIGNTDNHIKNLSLLYGPDLKTIRLAPAYDLVSTMVYESSTENMALSIGGIYRIYDITREAFAREAEAAGLGKNMAMKRLERMVAEFESSLKNAEESMEKQGFSGAKEISEKIRTNMKKLALWNEK